MGYAKTVEFGDWFEFPASLDAAVERQVAAAAADMGLSSITLPTFFNNIKHAYLQLYCGRIYNNSAVATNGIAANFYVQVKRGFGAWTDAIYIPQQAMTVLGANTVNPGFHFLGRIDVKDHFGSGETTNVQLEQISADQNWLELYDIFASVKIMLEV